MGGGTSIEENITAMAWKNEHRVTERTEKLYNTLCALCLCIQYKLFQTPINNSIQAVSYTHLTLPTIYSV